MAADFSTAKILTQGEARTLQGLFVQEGGSAGPARRRLGDLVTQLPTNAAKLALPTILASWFS